MQRTYNNGKISMEKSLNEICYNFISMTNSNLISRNKSVKFDVLFKKSIQDFITHTQLLFKDIYNQKYKSIELQINDWILVRLHKDYNIFSTVKVTSMIYSVNSSNIDILEV